MWQPGQKVVSQTEPELGIGFVKKFDTDNGLIEIYFSDSLETRFYSSLKPPVKRFRLDLGDSFQTPDGAQAKVEQVVEANLFYSYSFSGSSYWEYEITNLNKEQHSTIDDLFSILPSHHNTYDLRQEAWQLRSVAQSAKVRGLVGARVKPLAHQLYIASEVSRRPFPRVLLADEVGLGKTIEAGLIYSAMKSLGRADRVLIISPDPLIHQWMTEFYRKFGDMFSVLNEARCIEEENSQGISPFMSSQRIITSIDLIANNKNRLNQACSSPWDLIIVDESHHLDWDIDEPNERWLAIKSLSETTRALLLLTATPRQHGLSTQFGLLNLVDPDRYADFDTFLDESEMMRETAALAKEIASGRWNSDIEKKLQLIFSNDKKTRSILPLCSKDQKLRDQVLDELVDRHGTGRVLFRNRRERLKGFPKRVLHSIPLSCSSAYENHIGQLDPSEISDPSIIDFATGRGNKRSFCDKPKENPKFLWLESFIKENQKKKTLIICSSKTKVFEIENYLKNSLIAQKKIQLSVFHEDLSTIERDRQAANFADPKGANVLICSEIGGEGRNFQFTNQMIIMDLPRLPDLLEQRIGRLDRIGQGKVVNIHVPWLTNTPEEVLFDWYHKGLNIFEQAWHGADSLLEHFAEELIDLFKHFLPQHKKFHSRKKDLAQLVEQTQLKSSEIRREKAASVDVLLDLNSFDKSKGEELLELVEDLDDDPQLEFFMRGLFEHYGVDYEEIDSRGSLALRSESLMFIDHFPGLNPDKDTLLTFDREVALVREDIHFLSIDSKIAESSIGLLLDRTEGRSSICKWENAPCKNGILAQVLVVLESVGPKHLELNSYLPITCKTFTINHLGQEVSKLEQLIAKDSQNLLQPIEIDELPFNLHQMQSSIKPSLENCLAKSEKWAQNLKEEAIDKAERELSLECERLSYLASVNPNISSNEILFLQKYKNDVLEHLKASQIRIDSMRIIFTFD